MEEVEELIAAPTTQKFVGECADVLEVLHALAKKADVEMKTIEAVRQTKAIQNGAFRRRIILDRIEEP